MMGHYVGVNVGLRSSSLCIIDEQGKVCLEREVASEIEAIAAAIGAFAEHVDGVAKVYGVKLPVQIYHARFEDMARQAVMADPTLAEALGPLLDARGHLYRASRDR